MVVRWAGETKELMERIRRANRMLYRKKERRWLQGKLLRRGRQIRRLCSYEGENWDL